jgi:hypothetical protein
MDHELIDIPIAFGCIQVDDVGSAQAGHRRDDPYGVQPSEVRHGSAVPGTAPRLDLSGSRFLAREVPTDPWLSFDQEGGRLSLACRSRRSPCRYGHHDTPLRVDHDPNATSPIRAAQGVIESSPGQPRDSRSLERCHGSMVACARPDCHPTMTGHRMALCYNPRSVGL